MRRKTNDSRTGKEIPGFHVGIHVLLAPLLFAVLMLVACSSDREARPTPPIPIRDTPQLSSAEAIAVIKTWLSRSDSSLCEHIARRTDGWQAAYEGSGAWLVSHGSARQWRVFEKTASFEVVSGRC